MNENLILLKTKSAKDGSGRLVSVLFQHVPKNILVKRRGGMVLLRAGSGEGREGAALTSSIFALDWCKREAIT